MYYLGMLFLLLISSSASAESYDPILESMTPGSITIIGESHRRIASPKLIQVLVDAALKQNKCLTLALEIDDAQQPAIDRAMTEGGAVSGIAIASIIDHPPMRQMITHMASLKTKFPCLNLVAIDTGLSTPHDRDEWMAKRLAELTGDTPVLVLLSALHTLKKVVWQTSTGKPSVAEILTNKGLPVRSFPQRWRPDQCADNETRRSRFVSPDSPEALKVLNESLMSLINAKPHKSVRGVVDGFVLWECGNHVAARNEEFSSK